MALNGSSITLKIVERGEGFLEVSTWSFIKAFIISYVIVMVGLFVIGVFFGVLFDVLL